MYVRSYLSFACSILQSFSRNMYLFLSSADIYSRSFLNRFSLFVFWTVFCLFNCPFCTFGFRVLWFQLTSSVFASACYAMDAACAAVPKRLCTKCNRTPVQKSKTCEGMCCNCYSVAQDLPRKSNLRFRLRAKHKITAKHACNACANAPAQKHAHNCDGMCKKMLQRSQRVDKRDTGNETLQTL